MKNSMLRVVTVLAAVGLCRSASAQEGLEPLPPLPGAAEEAPAAEEVPAEEAPAEEADAPPPVEELEAVEDTLAEGRLAVRGSVDDSSVPKEAREALDAAVAALVAADYETARALLAQVSAALPEEHWLLPTVARLGQLAGVVERGLSRGAVEDESVASLYVTLTLYGFYSGVWLFGILGEIDFQATIPLSVATAGIGLGAAYLLDHGDEPLTGAVADGISAGLALGAAEAILLMSAINPDDFSDKAWFSLIWGSSLVGSVIGGYAAKVTGASRGDVALSTAGYTWGAVLGVTLAMTAAVDDFDNVAKVVLGGATAGLGAGIALASNYEMSASRVLYINLGGIAGALVGTGVVVGGSFDSIEPVGVTLGLTYVAGLATAWYLTRNLDLPESDLAFHAAPTMIPSPDPTRAPVPGMALTLAW